MRIAERVEQRLGAFEAELVAAGGPREEILQRVVVPNQVDVHPEAAGFPDM